MIRAPSILGLAGPVTPRVLGRRIEHQRRIGREPAVIELLPGVLGASILKVCRDRGVAVRTAEAAVGREGIRRVDAESKELTDRVFETLDRQNLTRVVWHLFYWYRLRRACLGAAILDSALAGYAYSVTLLGGDELLPGVLDGVCRKRGVRLTAPGAVAIPFARRLRTTRIDLSQPITLNGRLAPWLELASSLPRSLGGGRKVEPEDCLILTTLPHERATWRPLLERMPDEVRAGLVTTYPVMPRELPTGVRHYPLDAWVRFGHIGEWMRSYRSYWEMGPELPRVLPRLPWRGLDLGEFARGWLLYTVRRYLWGLVPRKVAFGELMETVRPGALVCLTERDGLINLAIRKAADMGIPSLAVESHDMIWDSPLFGRLEADRLAVSGAYSESIYAGNGVPRERMTVTGQPSFDVLARYREKGRVEKEADERLLVVITQPLDVALTEDMRREMLRGALLAGREIPRLRVKVKPHPRDNLRDLCLVLSELGAPREALLPKKLDLYGLLASADVVLTAFSTVGVEAIMLGRPVVVFKPDEKAGVLPYVDSGAVLRAGGAEEVARAIRAVFEGEILEKLARGREEYIAHHECAADGGGAERVVRLVLEMLNGEGRARI
jgi:hypothetical protein